MSLDNVEKEELSKAYARAISYMAGCNIDIPEHDIGVDDIKISQIIENENGFDDEGIYIRIQLKSTTDFEIRDNHIVYKLRNKNYNKLISNNSPTRKILVLLLLPLDKKEWISQDAESLILRKCAYWCYLDGKPRATGDSESKTTIKIPLTNVFSCETIEKMFKNIKEGGSFNEL